MSLLRAARMGLRSLLNKAAADDELDDEVRHYIEMATRENLRAGMSPAEAARAARLSFGGVEATKERVRAGAWEAAVEALARDLRYAVRGLRRSPAFTAIAIVTLALGIGANTAMFSVVNAVLLRPLPYRDASRLALIFTDDARRGLHEERTAFRTIADWRAQAHGFQDIAYFTANRSTLVDAASGARERTRSALASSNLFSVLGVAPVRGRPISADDEARRAPIAVISYSLWQRRFGGTDDIVGKTMPVEGDGKFGGGSLTVIGVMPAGFYFPDKQTEFWTPATTYWRFTRESTERFPQWARRWIAVGRLAPEASLANARSDLARIGERLAATYQSDIPDFPGFATNIVPVLDRVTGVDLQSALWVLLGAVGLVLLVSCANVANLLLARGASRQRELAVRRALGAERSRLVRQLLAESAVLASVGGLLGVALAVWTTRVLSVAAASRVPRIDEVAADPRVLIFAAGASLVAGLLFGVVPAFRVTHADASEALKDGGHTSGGVRLRRSRGVLVVVECSLAIVLLAGAGLLVRSLARLRSVDPGFDPRGVLTVRLELPPEAPLTSQERNQRSVTVETARAAASKQRADQLLARIRSLPGVDAAGFVDDLFITGQGNESITIPGHAMDSLAAGELNEGQVSAGFFPTMRVPLRRGRYLTDGDTYDKIRALWAPDRTDLSLAAKEQNATLEPVVVNETFVKRFFPTEDPIGKRFCIDPTNKTYWYVIVGVIRDMQRQGLEHAAIAEYFAPYLPRPTGRVDLLVRVKGDPLALAPSVRRVVADVIPNTLVSEVSTADRQLGDFSAQRRFQTALLAAFALLALVLAGVGIYGVVHYAVAERTKEIGVRVALGAAPADVITLVIAQGMHMPAVGIALGLAASLGLTRVLSHLLFGVAATDPITFIGVGGLLAVAAMAACYFPARRAALVDPVRALRQE